MTSRRARWLFALIVIIMGFAVYSNTFNVPFQWDGNTYITENQIIRNLDYFVHPTRAHDRHFYSQLVRRYVSYLTFALNYRVNGFSYPGWHLVNILIHIANALLSFALVLGLFKTPLLKDSSLSRHSQTIAFFCALYFVVHPMQTMAVTYIYQRLASLVTLFYLASTLAYLHSRIAESAKKRYLLYAASMVLAVIAMKTKETAMTLPLALTVLELMIFTGPLKKRLLLVAPIYVMAALVPVIVLSLVESPGGYIGRIDKTVKFFERAGSRYEYLFSQFKALVLYLRLYAFPFGQCLTHDSLAIQSFFEAGALLSLAFICTLIGIAAKLVIKGRKHRPELILIAFGIVWYFVVQLMESSVLRLPLKAQEYRAYLPSVGIFISAMTFATIMINSLSRAALRKAAYAGLVAIAMLYAVTAHERNKVWADPVTLWQDVVEKAPDNPRGYNNLGLLYAKQGMFKKALPLYQKAIEKDPGFGQAYNNLGKLFIAIGDTEGAEKALKLAIEVDPDVEEAFSNLGSIYSARGEFEPAMENLDKSIELNPDFAIAWYNRALLYQRMNDYDKAIPNYTRALSLNPTLDEAHTNLGAIYVKRQDYDRAIKHLSEAARLKPSSATAHFNIGYALYKGGYINAAEVEIKRSLRIDPNYERSLKLLRALSEQQQRR